MENTNNHPPPGTCILLCSYARNKRTSRDHHYTTQHIYFSYCGLQVYLVHLSYKISLLQRLPNRFIGNLSWDFTPALTKALYLLVLSDILPCLCRGLGSGIKLVPLFQLAPCFRVIWEKGKECLVQATGLPPHYHHSLSFHTKRKEPAIHRKLPAAAHGIPSHQKQKR